VGGIHAVQELLRVVTSTRDAQEAERKRRIAWEQEQEAKFAQRQEEIDKQVMSMHQEITSLRSLVNIQPPQPSNPFIPQIAGSHGMQDQLSSPLSPVSMPSSARLMPAYIEDPSSRTMNHQTYFNDISMNQQFPAQEMSAAGPSQSMNSPPPYLSISGSPPIRHQPPSSLHSRKRQTPQLAEDGDDESSDTESSLPPKRPIKRTNHHDTRCLTIQVGCRTDPFSAPIFS
jgi:hypothetical protein